MIAHDEAVGHQIVQCIVQPCDLRGGAVARRGHLILLALHHRPRRRLGEEAERLGDDEGEPRRQKTVPTARPRLRRIFFNPKDPGEAGLGGLADFQALASED